MKKLICQLMVMSVLVLGSISVASALTSAGNVVYTGFEQVFGTGFGTLDNLLVLQHTPNETGSVFPTNQTTGDATNQSRTYSFQELINLGINDASQLLLAYNNNETGANPDTFLISFMLTVWDTGGQEVASTSGLDVSANGSNNFTATIQQGQGKAAYVFDLDTDAINLLNTYFANPTQYFLGASGTINGTDDGPDGWYIIQSQGPVVPEPGTFLLLGTGFLGLAVYRKRRSARSL